MATDPPAPSSGAGNASHPQPDPETPAVRVDVVRLPAQEKERGRWVTTVGMVVVPALALVVAILAVYYQNQSSHSAQAAANRANASSVSFYRAVGDAFEIINLEPADINHVYVQARGGGRLQEVGSGTVRACSASVIMLANVTNPAIYFTDQAGHSWKLAADGTLLPSISSSAIFAAVPGAESSVSQVQPQPAPPPNCS